MVWSWPMVWSCCGVGLACECGVVQCRALSLPLLLLPQSKQVAQARWCMQTRCRCGWHAATRPWWAAASPQIASELLCPSACMRV